ncbi:MAG TPA: DUF2157 domain-containing protein [Leptolyngbyaceae cyanobacterium]
MESEKFRRQLRQEAEQWWRDGLIDASVYEVLAQRYQFQDLESEAKSRFVVILMSLGGILLGLGVITYVAANWQGWPREFRTLLLLALFLSVNAVGFYLWRRSPSQGGQRLGHALLLLGALILGANLGLMSQMFHQSGNLYELYLVWSLGVLAMAYGLRLASLGILALILMAMGYCVGLGAWYGGTASGWQVFIEQMPFAVAGLFVPLAYWCCSRALFGLAAIAVGLSLQSNLALLLSDDSSWSMIAIATALPPALLWSYSDRFWQWDQPKAIRLQQSQQKQPSPSPFQDITRPLSITFLSLFLYLVSFHGIWQYRWFDNIGSPMPQVKSLIFSVVVLGLLTLWGWAKIANQGLHQRQTPTRFLNSGTIAGLIALITGITVWHEVATLPTLGPVCINMLLFFLALALIRDGLALGTREMFWSGMVLLVVDIMSRTLEYNTDLLIKALAFALCGAGIIVAGLWFERHIKPAHTLQEKTR